MINPTSEVVRIKAGYPRGDLEPFEDEVEILPGSDSVLIHQCSTEGVAKTQSDGLDTGEEPVVPPETLEEETLQIPEFLRDLYRATAASIANGRIRQQLITLMQQRKGAFACNNMDLGRCQVDDVKHQINTGFAAPVRDRVRHTPKGFEDEERKCLDEQLQSGVVRPSSSAWAAATVLVRKADGSVRWCVDYRKLNDRTLKDAYPLPRIDMCFDSLGGSGWFTTLDLQSGYWQIPVAEADIPKTAFITKYGLYEYTKMPFGLCNAPSTFQRCMELVFRGLQWNTLLIYLDDIIVLGRSREENLVRLDEVLCRLINAGLKLKPSKCQLLRQEVLFLGHVVSSSGIRPNPRLVDAVTNWKAPTSRRKVQQYLGLCNYYRRFVPKFSTLACPLTRLTSKDITFRWDDAAQAAFEALKEALCSAPILSFPLEDGYYVLDTDASDIGIGAVLQQVQNGEERVLAYASKKLNKQQRRYCVTRRELLAIVVFLREFRNHLLGREFTIRTDHGSLTWLLHFKEPQGQLARWLEYIFQFRFRIQHHEGKKHGNADALSRQPASEADSCPSYRSRVAPPDLPCGGCAYCSKRHQEWGDFLENVDDVGPLSGACRQVVTRSQARKAKEASATVDEQPQSRPGSQTKVTSPTTGVQTDGTPEVEESRMHLATADWVTSIAPADVRAEQRHDPDLNELYQWLLEQKKPSREEAASLSPALRSYWLNFECLRIVDGLIYLRWEDSKSPKSPILKLLVPVKLRRKILQLCHDAIFSGHFGVRKTISRVRQRFHWYGLRADVKQHIRVCEVCCQNKLPLRKYRAAMANFRVGAPMDRVGIDLLGPLPLTKDGNKYLLVLVDYFTRWVEAFPLPDQTAETVARSFIHEFVCHFGAPLEVHSDQGRNFESNLFREACRLLEITKTRTTPYHPSSNGLVERFNRTLGTLIRTYIDGDHTKWDVYIPLLTSAYRSTTHPSTGFTPNYLMLGRETTMPIDLVFPHPAPPAGEIPEYVEELREKLSASYALAREALKNAAERQKKLHDTRIAQAHYTPGQAVFKRSFGGTKLCKPWVGPYIIIKSLSDCLYKVSDKKRTYVLHHDNLKPCNSEELPKWARSLRATLSISA